MTLAESKNKNGSALEAYRNIARFCVHFVVPESRHEAFVAITTVLCIIVAKVFHLVEGLFIKLAVDALSSNDANVRTSGSSRAAVLYLVGRVIVGISTIVFETAQEQYSARVKYRLAVHAFRTLMDQPVEFHEPRRVGETSLAVWNGVEAVDTIVRQLAFWLLPTALEAIYMAIIFCRLGTPLIAILVLMTVVAYALFTARLTNRRFSLANRRTQADAAKQAHATERLVEHTAISMFGITEKEVEKFEVLQSESRKAACNEKRISALFDVSADLILHFGVFSCFLVAASQASAGQLSIGDFTLAVSYISALFWPLLRLARGYGTVVDALANAEKFVNLVDATNGLQDAFLAKPLPSPKVDVPFLEYRDVRFSRKDGGGVESISLKVKHGQMIGIVGPSGAGKSTLVRLALRMYDVQDGAVLVHGADVRAVTRQSVRGSIAVVAQDTAVLNGTLRDNVKFGIINASDSAVMHALRLAGLHTFVKRLPDMLNTMIGERGMRLSGGERQRLGIARAMLKNSRILVLDEATSSLSAVDEKLVVNSIKDTISSRAVLVVAHRLSTIRDASEIVVMNNGCIVQRGTHQELIDIPGLYSEMWRLQNGEYLS